MSAEFENSMKSAFLEEAAQLLTDAEQCFLVLEKDPNDRSNLERLFRLAHNLKGSSRAVGFEILSHFTHELENLLLPVKKGELAATSRLIDLLLRCNDHLIAYVEALRENPDSVVDSSELLNEMTRFRNDPQSDTPPLEPQAESIEVTPEDAPVPVELAAQEFETESPKEASKPSPEIKPENPPRLPRPQEPTISVKAQDQDPLHADDTTVVAKKAEESIRVSLDRVEHLVNLVGEMVILQSVLRENSIQIQSSLIRNTIHQLGKVTQSVQDLSMSLRMIPLRQSFQKMQRIVRDVSKQLNKQVELSVAGEETEVDKTVLEFLGDPLVHLVRNAVDHGIESPEQRRANGKSEIGRIEIKAHHRSGNLIIEVIDDGGGIDADRLRKKAVEKGILKAGQSVSDDEARNLIFHPGFSTKDQVTDVSGRGVGMDVVKTQIERLQGEIGIHTQIGRGTRFTLRLPLTLAILEGMVMRCGPERFVVPLAHVHETVRVNANDVHFATGLGEVLLIRGESIPLYHLRDLMKIMPGAIPAKGTALGAAQATLAARSSEPSAVIVRLLDQPFAIHVDEILGQNQVVVKKLGPELAHLKTFSGGTILGDGRPSLILELIELVRANGKATRTKKLENSERKAA